MSTTKFKNPIKLPALPADPSEMEDGVLYYNTSEGKVVMGQDGQSVDTVSSADLSEAVTESIDDLKGAVSISWNTLEKIEDNTLAHINDTNNPHTVTKAQVGLGNVDNTNDLSKPVSVAQQAAIDAKVVDSIADGDTTRAPSRNAVFDALVLKANQATTYTKIETDTLLNGKENTITAGTTTQYYRGDKTFQTLNKAAIGLTNVDNTSDLNKPISIATQTALDLKSDRATTYSVMETDALLSTKENTIVAGSTSQYYRGDKTFQTLDKDAVGLNNVNNTSDLNKPISTATQNALNNKQNLNARLTNLSSLSGNGILVKSGDNILNRSVSTTAPISVTNANGVAGNVQITHDTSGVTAASYGAEDKNIVYTVNNTGHVTASSVVDTKPKKLNYIRLSDTSTVSTTSSTYSVITSMSTTPAAGTYIVTFSGNVYAQSTPREGNTAFYLDNTQITTSVRSINFASPLIGTAQGNNSASFINDVITVNGSQVISVRYNCVQGTVLCGARTLILLRVD